MIKNSIFVPIRILLIFLGTLLFPVSGANFISNIRVTTLAGSGSQGNADGVGLNTSFYSLTGNCVDYTGSTLYVTEASTFSRVRSVNIATGAVSTVLTGTNWFDNYGLVCDTAGGIYVSSWGKYIIYYANITRIQAQTSSASIIAGHSSSSGSADASPGASAYFSNLAYMTLSSDSSSLYVADNGNGRVRKVMTTWPFTVTTVASLINVFSVAVNSQYIFAITQSGRVIYRESLASCIGSAFTISTPYAGSGSLGSSDDSLLAASFSALYSVTIDTNGYLYVIDKNAVRQVTLSTVSTVAGAVATSGYQDGNGSFARFASAGGFAGLSTTSNPAAIYVTEYGGRHVRSIACASSYVFNSGSCGEYPSVRCSEAYVVCLCLVTMPSAAPSPAPSVSAAPTTTISYVPNTQVTTLSGSGNLGSADGSATASSFYEPGGTCVDSSGTYLYVTQYSTYGPRRVSLATGAVTSILTGGSWFNTYGIACDGSQGIYIGSFGSSVIYYASNTLIATVSAVPSTVAGSSAGTADSSSGTSASFYHPELISLDATSSYLYIADYGNGLVRKMSTTYPNAVSTAASLLNVYSVVVDSTYLYAIKYNLATIYRASLSSCTSSAFSISTVYAGQGTVGFLDGPRLTAKFSKTISLAIDSSSNLYVVDYEAIRLVTATSVYTLAGSSYPGYQDGNGSYALLRSYGGFAGVVYSDPSAVYVGDCYNSRIRVIACATGYKLSFGSCGESASTI